MRFEYNILWLDDEFKDEPLALRQRVLSIEKYIKSLHFIPNIIKVKDFDSAVKYINNDTHIDLFISDFNIGLSEDGSKKTGLDFLDVVRTKFNKDIFLYSNASTEQIKNSLISHLKMNNDLSLFSRFSFESANNPEILVGKISNTINYSIEKWNELSALRGLYLSEISQIEEELKKLIENTTDKSQLILNQQKLHQHLQLIDINNTEKYTLEFMQYILIDNSSNLFSTFSKIRKDRNSLAHVLEKKDDKGYYIEGKKYKGRTYKIYEDEIKVKRSELLLFLKEINLFCKKYEKEIIEKQNSDIQTIVCEI